MNVAGLVVGQDVATAVCGLFNAGYFAGRWWQSDDTRGRRIGAAALALVSAAAVAEAIFSQAVFWSQEWAMAPGVWALVRFPLFAATLAISIIIARRLAWLR